VFKICYNLLRLLAFPFLNGPLLLISSKALARVRFERGEDLQKSFSHAFKSFHKDGEKADFAFEVSSEGELEQVKPLIEFVLNKGLKVELIYCSDSVDHKCLQLFEKYSQQVRLLRLPILSYSSFSDNCPYKWLSAPKLFLCRYDFFPELIFYGQRNDIEFILLWGTLKNFPTKWPMDIYQKYVYHQFDKIVTATNVDQKRFQDILKIPNTLTNVYDFRPWQIIKRLEVGEKTLKEKLSKHSDILHSQLINFFNQFPIQKKIIFGSFWDNEVQVFNNNDYSELLEQGYLVVIVCHKLAPTYLKDVAQKIQDLSSQPVYSINTDSSFEDVTLQLQAYRSRPGVIMLNLKGILCELYSHFGHAFVGGGHGVSVHSLLEPFLAGTNVYCGPRVHRSTEYDLIVESCSERLHVIESLSQFFPLISGQRNLEYEVQNKKLQGLKSYYLEHFHKVLRWLEIAND
jgi:3-deoxy-D-manno-octulosonic-acid transferase